MVWNGNGWDLRLRDGTTLVYGDLAPLQSIRDRFGHSVKIRRIAKNSWGSQIGAIVSVTSSEGYWLSYDYNTVGQITAIHDNAGRTVSYTYDTGLLKTVTDVNGGVTTYGWDASKRLTTITDAKNQLFLPGGLRRAEPGRRVGRLRGERFRGASGQARWTRAPDRTPNYFGR